MNAIEVSNLSKRYRLGIKEKQADTLMGQISQIIRSPYENLKRLRDLNRFRQEDESVFWALKDVSFEVKEGEVLGIIGKNGAGKSTLLKILSQITEPTSGKVEIHGRVASLLEVGTGFHSELSGRENIYMNGTILGMTRREIDSKLDVIIDFSGVEKFIDTPVKFYSSGMKVRLGFSVAAHLDPEILIIDEVLAVGDHEFQKKCLGKMEDVSKNQGRTVLFVSHNLDAVSNLCHQTVILQNGVLIDCGSTDKMIYNYLNSNQTESPNTLVFEGPLSKSFKLISGTLNENNLLSDQVVLTRESQLEFKFVLFSDYLQDFKTIISIYKNGIKIFSLFDDRNYSSSNQKFSVVSKIKSGILSPGNYFVSLGMHSKDDKWSWISEFCSFTILQSVEFDSDFRDFGFINGESISETYRI